MSWQIDLGKAEQLALDDQSVDMVFTSPPYCDARTYGIGVKFDTESWIDFMLRVVAESCRVSRGPVFVNCAGVTHDKCYWPACEGLLYRWWQQGGQCLRPAYWHRVGIPGSGGKQWLASRVEYVLAFKAGDDLPYAMNTANGHDPKYAEAGGPLSYRTVDGRRVNAGTGTMRMPNGKDGEGEAKANRRRPMPKKANPGNLISSVRNGPGAYVDEDEKPVLVDVVVGGGKMGHPLASENEAPFPLDLPKWFIRSWCPPGGKVLDPFCGSGSTVHAAFELGCEGIGFDCRLSQVFLGRKRMREVERANETAATAS